MIKVVRPFLKRVGDLHNTKENLGKPIVAIFFLTLILSAYATEVIGIHALFGAFMAGAIMPINANFRNIFIEKVEDVALVLLLPLFFVYTGLRTEIGLLNDPYLWKVTGLIILVAIVGKFIGSAIAAKYVGQNWKDSLTIGALMNTRGLMELVVLNIGYDLGVLTPEIFAMMVIMALVTTFMTGPALDLINWTFKKNKKPATNKIIQQGKYKILISFGHPERGRSLLRLAHAFVKKANGNVSISAMHLTPIDEINQHNSQQYEHDSFFPIKTESERLDQKILTLFKATHDIDSDIIDVTNRGNFDLLLIGEGQSIFEGSMLGKVLGFTTKIISPEKFYNQVTGKEGFFENSPFDERTKNIVKKSNASVGILIDKGFESASSVFIPVFNEDDRFILSYAQKLIKNSESQITFLDASGKLYNNLEFKESIRLIEQVAPNHIQLIKEKIIHRDFLQSQDLMIISHQSWKELIDTKSVWLAEIPSTLILKEK